jgi:DNA-binding MarR family transcriptional regulator
MLKKLYGKGYFDYKKFILENQKKLGLTPNEALVLMELLDSYSNGCDLVSVDDIQNSILLPKDELTEALSKLLTKKYYTIFLKEKDMKSYEAISLDGFFNHAKDIINNTLSDADSDLYTITSILQDKINRILTSSELDIVQTLVNDDKYTLNDFNNVISNLEAKKRKITIKVIAQELAQPSSQPKPKKTNKMINDFISKIK